MVKDTFSSKKYQKSQLENGRRLNINLERSQENIYSFFLDIVQDNPPEVVHEEFKCLFFCCRKTELNAEILPEISAIIFANNEAEFVNTLKRCCYILINNWETKRYHSHIINLVNGFTDIDVQKKSLSRSISRLRLWLKNFVESPDYEDIKLFNCTKNNKEYGKQHWSERYASYLLVPQYVNSDNPREQREAAIALAKKLKYQFKFDLAMYTARCQSKFYHGDTLDNPTALGDEVLWLIKKIVAKKGKFSYKNLANIYLKQIDGQKYQVFKQSLPKYLLYSISHQANVETLHQKLAKNLTTLYQEYEEDALNSALILRTCNRLFDYLTTIDGQEPSDFFIFLMSHGSNMTLVILLLKIILICPHARNHLDNKIAQLIKYYMDYPQEECHWVVHFFEIFNVIFAIHADNQIQYNLIKINSDDSEEITEENLESYRIFSQRHMGKPQL